MAGLTCLAFGGAVVTAGYVVAAWAADQGVDTNGVAVVLAVVAIILLAGKH